jgi:predicted PurR-regulated permease PerM
MASRDSVRDHQFSARYEAPPDLDTGPETQRSERRSLRAKSFHLCLAVTCVAAALTFVPLWAPLLLASWMALVFKPLHARLVHRAGGRGGAAAVVTVLLVVGALTPVVVMTLSLVDSAASLANQLQKSNGAREALQTLISSEPTVAPVKFDPHQIQLHAKEILGFAQRHGGGALSAASTIFGAATNGAIALLVFVYGFYVFLVHSRTFHEWLVDHSPLERWQTLRLSRAYSETGRGLLIGVGLTAAFQGGVATIGYVIIGTPQPLVLGLLTTIAAVIPSIGTGLVWVPLAAGLALAHRMGQAAAIVGLGVVISVADNFIRPWLSRFGKVDLDMFVLFIAMLGGIAMFGTWGLLIGPLFVRLAIEALRLGRERHDLGDSGRLLHTPGELAETHEDGAHA